MWLLCCIVVVVALFSLMPYKPQNWIFMKKLILPLLVAGAFAAPSMAQAASKPYASFSTGLSLMNNSSASAGVLTVSDAITYKTGYLVNGAVGLKNGDVRVEAEIGYHHNSADKAIQDISLVPHPYSGLTVSMWTFMANAYHDFDMKGSGITPFVMGGLGLANCKYNDNGATQSTTKFAWQLGAGIGIKASKDVTVDLGYRYLKPSAPTFDGKKYTVSASELLAGVRCSF
jgi:opacity protein-like surface antigen